MDIASNLYNSINFIKKLRLISDFFDQDIILPPPQNITNNDINITDMLYSLITDNIYTLPIQKPIISMQLNPYNSNTLSLFNSGFGPLLINETKVEFCLFEMKAILLLDVIMTKPRLLTPFDKLENIDNYPLDIQFTTSDGSEVQYKLLQVLETNPPGADA